jgi:predicted transcriptional regulator
MNNVALMSIKPEYSSKILTRVKDIELRRSSMGLAKNDIVIVYESAPKQVLGLWFRIADVETLPVTEMWSKYDGKLGIDQDSYFSYFEGCAEATGLHIGDVFPLDPPISLSRIRDLVPDFVPPQGILWVRDNALRFKNLVCEISPPLPSEVFHQLCLFNDH